MGEVLANPKAVNERLVLAWDMALKLAGVHAEQVAPTVARLLQTQTFFPTPADFLKIVNPAEDREAGEELVWQKVLDCVRKIGPNASLRREDLGGDGTALWAVDRMGWERLCRELTFDNRSIMRADFVRLYRAGKTTGAALDYVAGWLHKANENEGHQVTTPALVGRPEWEALPAAPVATPVLPSPVCPECGSRSRHLLWCSALDYLDERKALPAPDGMSALGDVTIEEAA